MSELVQTSPHAWSAAYLHNPDAPQQFWRHHCWSCCPSEFPPMPDFHTLCTRCGDLIKVSELDPFNMAMVACLRCEIEIRPTDA